MSFLRLNNLLRKRPDPKREYRPDHDAWAPSGDALQGKIDRTAAMQRAMREDEPSRLRQRVEALEARAAAAEAEAQKAKGALAKAVLEAARAAEAGKDAQRRLRADLQTKIDTLREALALANADNASNSGGAAMSEATKNALKANLALRLETMQERHNHDLEHLAKEAEDRLANEVEAKLSEMQAEWDRARRDAVAERDRHWESELDRRLKLARMPAPIEPLETTDDSQIPKPRQIAFIESARSFLPQGRQTLGLAGVGLVAAVIGFAAAQIASNPTADTARAAPAAAETHGVVTTAEPATPPQPQSVGETLPAAEMSSPVTAVATATPSTPVAEPAEATDTAAETPRPAPPRVETANPPAGPASETTRHAGLADPAAATRPQVKTKSERAARPTKAKAATGTRVSEDKAAAAQVQTLRRQARQLRQRLRTAERRAAAARRDALAATSALEEAQARIQPANDAGKAAGGAGTTDPADFFAPTE